MLLSYSAAAVACLACLTGQTAAHEDQHQLVFSAGSQHEEPQGVLPRPRVAIVGGGAGGTSAAFFLRHLARLEPRLATDVDLFEVNDSLGGRTTTVQPFDDDRYPPLEVGGSIFVTANKNLQKAARVFNLTMQGMHGDGGKAGDDDDEPGLMGIWNGENFVYKESSGFGWWNLAKMFWRYGYSPMTVKNTVTETVAKFVELYGEDFQARGPYDTLQAYTKHLDPTRLAYNDTTSFLRSRGVTSLFIEELVAAATRVNYGQNPSQLQAFEGMVSMAATGGTSIKGGNRLLFERFAKESQADIHLNTRVESIRRLDESWDAASASSLRSPVDATVVQPAGKQWIIRRRDVRTGRSTLQAYDAVIFATPIHPQVPSTSPAIKFIDSDIPSRVPAISYIHLHVTLIVTNATSARPEFFGKPSGEKIPKTVLSTFEAFERGKSQTRPRVNSLNYLRSLGKLDDATGKAYAVKIFSEAEMTDEELIEAFGPTEVLWVYRKAWPSYPESPPFGEHEKLASFKPDPKSQLYYVNAFERWVSTMETETVSAWNAVGLLARDLFGYRVKKSWAEYDEE